MDHVHKKAEKPSCSILLSGSRAVPRVYVYDLNKRMNSFNLSFAQALMKPFPPKKTCCGKSGQLAYEG